MEVCVPGSSGGEKNQRLLKQESKYDIYPGQRKEQGQEANAGSECCERETGRGCGVAESLVVVSAASRER